MGECPGAPACARIVAAGKIRGKLLRPPPNPGTFISSYRITGFSCSDLLVGGGPGDGAPTCARIVAAGKFRGGSLNGVRVGIQGQ